jgi:hypothetical protein
MSNAICRSSLSVGIRPAPKTGRHLPKLAVGGHSSCAEDRITVSARTLTLARSS